MVPDRPHSNVAAVIIDAAGEGRFEAVVSASSLKDIYYITRKSLADDIVRDYIAAFLDLMEVAPVDRAACADALRSDEPDFEDGIVRAIAESSGADFIVTRDGKAFGKSGVRAMTSALFAEVIA